MTWLWLRFVRKLIGDLESNVPAHLLNAYGKPDPLPPLEPLPPRQERD